ncbi:hypothetical protein TNIN_178091 [Trichonephila inaurata madagascariensis]|uniref:Uncharacterized protein n=1 Tax=Trichonephila inaurata madagascariensis TaxID=2747483 RepID=A0A8X6XW66_9ARAC|nr:hypothetical protein TNIN_275591 [Trichonephila inaurata madagascariensis]GFY59819.1 hypothetical protein TNIN_178091 [Trichonephila inaurata madagascariensis]
MCSRKLCWSSFILWASKSKVQLFLRTDKALGDYVAIWDSKDIELVVKRIHDTRWCVIADATMALSKGCSSLHKALRVIA